MSLAKYKSKIQINITAEDKKRITALAQQMNLSQSEFGRVLLQKGLQTYNDNGDESK